MHTGTALLLALALLGGTPGTAISAAKQQHDLSPTPLSRTTADAQLLWSRLNTGLPQPLYANFDLFIYVNKAEQGPWAQHLYAFAKPSSASPNPEMILMLDAPVSTGRETTERAKNGQRVSTATPAGFYEFDADRFETGHRSRQWLEDMPNAMFFNWDNNGARTGLAIHGVTDQASTAALGHRASAGCIQLSLDASRMLMDLVATGDKSRNAFRLVPHHCHGRHIMRQHRVLGSARMANYRGIYINLERSTARRAAMQAQLEKFGVTPLYTRFAAIDGSRIARQSGSAIAPGEEGAFRSHAEAIREASSHTAPLHVLEDDALLSSSTQPIISEAIASGLLDRFDILFTDSFVAPDLGMLKVLTYAFQKSRARNSDRVELADLQLFDISRQNFSCLTSYVVSPKAFPRLISLLDAELKRSPRMPVDLYLRQCAQAGKITAGLLAPFVTSFNLAEVRQSTIAAGVEGTKRSVLVLAVLRYFFFIERDLVAAKACLESALAGVARGPRDETQLVLEALEFILSDEFREF